MAADPSFIVDGRSYPAKSLAVAFVPSTPLRLTAPVTANLNPAGCYSATVSVRASASNAITVRLYSGTGNLRVYDSASCLTTLTQVTLAPNKSQTVYVKPVAPDVTYASLVADTRNVNPLPTAPASTGLTFYYLP